MPEPKCTPGVRSSVSIRVSAYPLLRWTCNIRRRRDALALRETAFACLLALLVFVFVFAVPIAFVLCQCNAVVSECAAKYAAIRRSSASVICSARSLKQQNGGEAMHESNGDLPLFLSLSSPSESEKLLGPTRLRGCFGAAPVELALLLSSFRAESEFLQLCEQKRPVPAP